MVPVFVLYSDAEWPITEHDVVQSGSADGALSAVGCCRAPFSSAQSVYPHAQKTGQSRQRPVFHVHGWCRSGRVVFCVQAVAVEDWKCDRKVVGSTPSRNGRRFFFSVVNFLYWLLFRYRFHPDVTAVACKRPWSFFQKCMWQITRKGAYTPDPAKLVWADCAVQAQCGNPSGKWARMQLVRESSSSHSS